MKTSRNIQDIVGETMDIKTVVSEKLNEIEQRENVRILHCVESGSRAWGFESPDSDYDVRFIYVRPKDYYLKLESTRDVIEWQLDDTLDINGWDIQKMLRLLYKSNPTVFEWSSSPIIYKTTDDWSAVSEVIGSYFQVKAGLYHYLSMAKTNYHAYFKGEQVKLKKYFYVLRPLLACRYIIDNGKPPPMLFSKLVESELESSMKPFVDEILKAKMATSELGTQPKNDKVIRYFESSIAEIEKVIADYSKEEKMSWEPLDKCFLDILNGNVCP